MQNPFCNLQISSSLDGIQFILYKHTTNHIRFVCNFLTYMLVLLSFYQL